MAGADTASIHCSSSIIKHALNVYLNMMSVRSDP